MTLALSITESQVFTLLRAWLLSVLPAGVEVVQGQVNQVPEPASPDYVVMWPLSRPRLATNGHTFTDTVFTASIAGNLMTVSAMREGSDPVVLQSVVYGVGVTPATILTQTGGTPGGAGTYTLDGAAQTVASETMASGLVNVVQSTAIHIQLDVHGPSSADNAQVISTLLRDETAVAFFDSPPIQDPPLPVIECEPLYVEDPRQAPFISGEAQYENRWMVDAVLQANPVISSPMQFADSADVVLKSVDATFPP